MVVVGCGNIGSQVVPHLGRIAGLARVVLVDPDAYEHANLRGQAIEADDVGRSKALVQRERLARIAPDLDGLAICKRIEQVPLGHLRDAIVLACVDSRAARQAINEATWRIGRAWIDAAVDGSQLIARTIVHVPAADGACLECAWSEADYLALETAVPCTEAAVDDAAAVARGEHR